MIWGSAFVVQRIAALDVGVLLFNGLRFLVGALALLPFAWRERMAPPVWRKANWVGVLMAGTLLAGGAALQQAGLQYTTAGNAGFITGLYVVLIPLFLAFGWRQRPRPAIWVAALLAAIGLFLLSIGGSLRLNAGDILELGGAVFWALHVILIGRLVERMDIMRLAAGQYLVCGLLSILVGLVFEATDWPALLSGWWAIFYTGIISVGLGYTLQALGQRHAPPADTAILLSMEAAFAALFGWIFLGEVLSALQLLGCGIMFAGVLLAQSDLIFGAER